MKRKLTMPAHANYPYQLCNMEFEGLRFDSLGGLRIYFFVVSS